MKAASIVEYLFSLDISVKCTGDSEVEIVGFSSLYNYKANTLTWARYEKTIDEVESDHFQCLITGADVSDIQKADFQIKVEDPRAVFFLVVDHFWGIKEEKVISRKALIEDGAIIGDNVSIGPFTYVSAQSEIGSDCVIGSNVTIKGKVHIGNRTIIQSGAVIGEDGFAFTKDNGGLNFVKHYGGVWIGENVTIGANTCIVRGTIDDTIIKNMAKIDNLCHIAHNTVIGERAEIIASSTVMGSVHIGDDTWVATSMIRDQRHVGSNSVIGMGAVVVKDVPDNTTVAGNPAKPFERKEKI